MNRIHAPARPHLWLLSLLALLLLVAACAAPAAAPAAPAGGAEAPAAEAPAAEAPAEAEAAEAPAGDLPVVRVGTNAEYQPFEFVDENGDIVGFDVDIINAIAERAGFTPEFVNTKWDGIFVALANGEFDLVASAVTITEERQQTIDFSDPYFNAGQAIAVRADNTEITGPDSLTEGVRVGVQLGTTGDIWLTDNTGADVQRFDENPLAVQALAAGDLDAVVADAPTLADILRQNPEMNLKIVGEPFTEELYGIGIRKGQDDLKASINEALAALRDDGTYDEIYNKWFGAEGAADQ
jgi:polar amino acid transport system substrate-binding protein